MQILRRNEQILRRNTKDQFIVAQRIVYKEISKKQYSKSRHNKEKCSQFAKSANAENKQRQTLGVKVRKERKRFREVQAANKVALAMDNTEKKFDTLFRRAQDM